MPRLAFTFFILCAFLFQSYVTQTHVHLPGHTDTHAVTLLGAKNTPVDAKAIPSQDRDQHGVPSKDDPENCPLCQQIAIAGFFVVPVVSILCLPSEAGPFSALIRIAPLVAQQPSHSWQGRAPPFV